MASSPFLSALLRLRRRLGYRGTFLLFLAEVDFVYAFSLFAPTANSIRTPIYVFLGGIMPLFLWGSIWLTVALTLVYYAFKKHDAVGFAVAAMLKTFWALTLLLAWLFGHLERGYLSAAVWGTLAALVVLISNWAEPDKRREVK